MLVRRKSRIKKVWWDFAPQTWKEDNKGIHIPALFIANTFEACHLKSHDESCIYIYYQ